jgi:hypothetical protein
MSPVAAQQQDYPLLSELLSVVTQSGAYRCQRKLDDYRQGDGLKALARWRGQDIRPGTHDEVLPSRSPL